MRRTYLSAILILLTAVIGRYAYSLYAPGISVQADSYAYYEQGILAFDTPRIDYVIHFYRTPLYPFLITLIMKLSGYYKAAIGSPPFAQGSVSIMFFAHIFGVAMSLVYVALLKKLKIPEPWPLVLGMIHAGNMLIIPWERSLLTESIAISASILFFYVTVRLLQKPVRRWFAAFFAISVLCVLIRPAFLPMPVTALFMIVLFHKNGKVLLNSIVTVCAYLLIPLSFIVVNAAYRGFPEFQITGTINLLGRGLVHRFPADKPSDETGFFYGKYVSYVQNGYEPNPYRFIDYADFETYAHPGRLRQLKTFTGDLVRKNLSGYITTTIRDLPQAVTAIDPTILVTPSENPVSRPLSYIQIILQAVLWLYLVTAVCTVFLIRKKPEILVLSVITFIQTVFMVFSGYEAFGRLLSPMVPMYIFLAFIQTQTLLRTVYDMRHSKI